MREERYAGRIRAVTKYILPTDSSTHGSLEGYELANVGRRNRSFPSSIALALRALSHPHTGVLWLSMSSMSCQRRIAGGEEF